MAIVFFRTIILYFVIILAVRIMGKRQIGELQSSELVVTILISELAAIPMQESERPFLFGLIPIITLVCFELIFSYIGMSSTKVRRIIVGSPSIIIKNGVISQKEMRRQRYSIDDLLEDVRFAGCKSLDEVEFAVLEANGKLSVFPRSELSPVCPQLLDLPAEEKEIPHVLISDGRIIDKSLESLQKSEKWLYQTLKDSGYHSVQEIFLMYTDHQDNMYIIPKEQPDQEVS